MLEKDGLAQLKRENRALELRHQHGMTFASIAQELGYETIAGAQKAYRRALKRVEVLNAEDYLQADLDRLDEMTSVYWQSALQGNVRSADMVLRIMQKRADFLGLDAPKKVQAEEPSWKIAGLRYFNVYGPREGHKGIPASMAWHLAGQMLQGKRPRIFASGEQKRDFVYVKDIVALTLAAMKAGKSGVWNAGSGQPRSFNEMVEGLNGVLGTKLKPEYFECPYPFYQPHTEAELSATERDLKIKPKFSLEQGLADYEKSGWLTRGRVLVKAAK